jgi:hypothetical protein
VFTARYALSPYIKQTGFVLKGLIAGEVPREEPISVQLCPSQALLEPLSD